MDLTNVLHMGIICIFSFFFLIGLFGVIKQVIRKRENNRYNKKTSLSIRDYLLKQEWYIKHEESIREKGARLYPLGVPEEYTPEGILDFQIKTISVTMGTTIVLYIVTKIFILPIIGLAISGYFLVSREQMIQSKLKEKEDDFDSRLPQFENSLLMGINAGASLSKAMELAIDSLMECPSKEEFELLWTQTKTSTADPSFPYLELARRIHTKECDQFTNLIINGLRNGTSMGEILESNSTYMMGVMKNRIEEKNEKNKTRATMYTSAFVLLPLIVIFLAPMVSGV